MTDRPEIGRLIHVSLGEMLPTLKEHPELCTMTPFPAVGLQMQLAHQADDQYVLVIRRIKDPEHVMKAEVIDADTVARRFAAMQLLTDMVTERQAAAALAGGADEVEQFLAQQASGE